MNKYRNNNTGVVEFEDSLRDDFNDFFDEIYPSVKFGSLEYCASPVLEQVDPIAYRQEFLNWLDSEGWECL